MRKKFALFVAVVACGVTSAAIAAEEVLLVTPVAPAPKTYASPVTPASGTVISNQPILQTVPQNSQPVIVNSAPIPVVNVLPGQELPLFTNVRVRDPKRVACNSVPMLVTVKDPCECRDKCACRDNCACSAPKCVNVQICAPACTECPPKVTCKKDGGYVRYDFGTWRVEVRSRKGYVEVDYDGPKSS